MQHNGDVSPKTHK